MAIQENAENTFFTDFTRNRFIAHLQNGSSEKTAMKMLRIPEQTYKKWKKWAESEFEEYACFEGTEDEQPLKPYAQFLLDVECAKAAHCHMFKMQVQMLYLEDTRYGPILQRLLEAEHPEYYVKQTKVENNINKEIRYTFRTVNGEEFTKPRLQDGGKIIEEESSGDIIEAAYARQGKS